MASLLVQLIVSDDPTVRNQALTAACASLPFDALIAECAALDVFRRESRNLYHRVRALFFLYAIYRFILPEKLPQNQLGYLSAHAHEHLLERRFAEAIETFLTASKADGLTDTLCSALAQAYYQLGIQNLADQVRRSVRSVRGNQWMFRIGHPLDHPLEVLTRLRVPDSEGGAFPILHERTAVRMDLSHSSWSDIFFLGMDYPEGAKVLNVSINLAVRGRDGEPRPPVEACFRVIDEPIIRLASLDLNAVAEIRDLADVFNFAKDYLGLLKGAIISAGIVPIGMEGSGQDLSRLLERLVGPGRGFELVSSVNGIPKGSRLAVSTNLLGCMIAVLMRATGQTAALTGPLSESERRLVAARAILGEWLGGSGGGWQDSGGVWPGIKVICGAEAREGDPEQGISRGRLLPEHRLIGPERVSEETRAKLQDSLVLVHGGMAQNVGPILEMVTEKYLLRSAAEWTARQESLAMFEEILAALEQGDIKRLGDLTTRHFFGPLQTIIPWSTTYYTEELIKRVRAEFGDAFWGFWMLGGMSGGGMGFMFDPSRKDEARDRLAVIMMETKRHLEHSLPFSMDPVVYDFAINDRGTEACLLESEIAVMPSGYYPLMLPGLLRKDPRSLTNAQRNDVARFSRGLETDDTMKTAGRRLLQNLFPQDGDAATQDHDLQGLLHRYGFDPIQHESIRADLRSGLIGLSMNRLHADARIEDVAPGDVTQTSALEPDDFRIGKAALENGEAGVISLAAGAASRWTGGAGVVKALHPFCKFSGKHRTFLEVHLAKSRRIGRDHGVDPAHLITTSYLTNGPISRYLERENHYGFQGPLHLSLGRSIGLRLVPMERDLRFAWESMPQQVLDERAQKVRASLREALISWAQSTGEASDYRDNLPMQCLHPVGHWFEFPNLLLNGTLRALLDERPQLRVLMMHNIDTLGANLDAAILGRHLRSERALSFEVIPRRLEDRGGGLARVNGRLRLLEGLAMPREEDEFKLAYYNTLTNWISIDPMLNLFGLDRESLKDERKVAAAVREFGRKLPTYITLKEVKKRWGHGQEDVFPVAQFEKLWGDMSALNEVPCGFFAVPRRRGQQLKEPAQLDAWLRDGSRDFVDALCAWDD